MCALFNVKSYRNTLMQSLQDNVISRRNRNVGTLLNIFQNYIVKVNIEKQYPFFSVLLF